MTTFPISFLIFAAVMLMACEDSVPPADAYGNFEATEILVSAEQAGRLVMLKADEGQWLNTGDLVAIVDTSALALQKQQVLAQIQAVLSRTQSIDPQLAVFDRQLDNLLREQSRVQKLLADSAATSQTLDEITGQIEVVKQQKEATLVRLSSANKSVNQEVQPLKVQLDILNDRIDRCYVRAPQDGLVLISYAEPSEITAPGKPLLKLADTRDMTLRIFVSGNQLSEFAVGKEVEVQFDQAEGMASTTGKVSWVSDQAEFTPKSLQTREDRVDLVYAAKVSVSNPDGQLKIGMPGEVNW